MSGSVKLKELVSEFKQVQDNMKFLGVDISVDETNEMELKKSIAINNRLMDEFPHARDLLDNR
jgi:hypothetical protein